MAYQRPNPLSPRAFAFALLAGLFFAAAPLAAETARPMTDRAISDAVEEEMLVDRAVPSFQIDVDTKQGVVTLTGTVDDLLAKTRAVRVAETVKGVRSVIDRIEVHHSERPDEEIRKDVERALLDDPAADSYEVTTKVADGEVTLSGTVDSWVERNHAEHVARGVRGVRDVANKIDVEYTTERVDHEIEADVESALHWDRYVEAGRIDVAVDDGHVELSGKVSSAAEARRAERLAYVLGVESIDRTDLIVDPLLEDPTRDEAFTEHDKAEVKDAVEDALMLDPRVLSFDIDTSVIGGTVTLRGTVDNLKAKRAAESVARNTIGVFRVKNYIKVRPPADTSDDAVAERVRQALVRDPYVERYEIALGVDDGIVVLHGEVHSQFEKAQAEEVASRIAGVTSVVNRLEVDEWDRLTYDPYLDEWYAYDLDWYYEPTGARAATMDWEIREDIMDQLWWSPFIDSDEVTVTVEDGTATLRGTVDTWRESQAATENALEGGAHHVVNKIDVRHGPNYES